MKHSSPYGARLDDPLLSHDEATYNGSRGADRRTTADMVRMQRETLARQDRSLEEISKGLGVVNQIGSAIGDDIEDTTQLLDDIDTDVARTQANLLAKTERIEGLNETGGLCSYYVCIVILIVLLIFLLATHGKETLQEGIVCSRIDQSVLLVLILDDNDVCSLFPLFLCHSGGKTIIG